MPKLHTSDLFEKFCGNEEHAYIKSVAMCTERKQRRRGEGGRRGTERRKGKEGKGATGILHSRSGG